MFAFADARMGRFAAWGTAVLRGRVGIDDAIDALDADADSLTMVGLVDNDEPLGLALGLGQLRRMSVSGLAYVTAVPGDISALPGPSQFNAAAVSIGGAVVTTDGRPVGLLAHVDERGPIDDRIISVEWRAYRVAGFARPTAASMSDAERELMERIHSALQELERLDVPRWHDDVAELLRSWRNGCNDMLPPGLPDRAARLLDRAERLGELLELAETNDGGAVTATEAAARQLCLLPLARAVRLAAATAWNCGLSPAAAAR